MHKFRKATLYIHKIFITQQYSETDRNMISHEDNFSSGRIGKNMFVHREHHNAITKREKKNKICLESQIFP